MKTTAALLRTPDGPFQLEEVTLRDLGDSELLVEIAAVGLCQTDVVARRPAFTAQRPIILGHEGAGVVVATGAAVRDIALGDHVVLSFDSCGACEECVAGLEGDCRRLLEVNVGAYAEDRSATDRHGQPVSARWFGQSSFARHAIAHQRSAVVVDPALPFDVLAPLGCSVMTGVSSMLNSLAVRPGDKVGVYGVGAVGLAAVMGAAAAGAAAIMAIDRHPHRLATARRVGATHAVCVSDASPDGGASDEQVRSAFPDGLDVALDTTGVGAVIVSAVEATRSGGRVGLVGVQHGALVLRDNVLDGKSVHAILGGGVAPRVMIPRLIELWKQGRLPVEELITSFSLKDIDAAEVSARSGSVIKPVLIP